MSRVRTTVHPVILTGSRRAPARNNLSRHNLIIDLARDCFDGDLYGWAMENLYAVELLRAEYDSPRIGGGIDPAIAVIRGDGSDSSAYQYIAPELESLRERNPGLFVDAIQDMIVHAEAVFDLIITQARLNGKDY